MVNIDIISLLTSENAALAIAMAIIYKIIKTLYESRFAGLDDDQLRHRSALAGVRKRVKNSDRLYVTDETPQDAIRAHLESSEVNGCIERKKRTIDRLRDDTGSGVCVRGCEVEDADEGVLYVALVRGRWLASRESHTLAGAVRHVALDDADEENRPPATLTEYYAVRALDNGLVDEQDAEQACYADAATRLYVELGDEDKEGDLTKLVKNYAYKPEYRYPSWVVEDVLDMYEETGVLTVIGDRISFMRY